MEISENKIKQIIRNIISETLSHDTINNISHTISDLPNGIYNGLFYGYTFELRNGQKYSTPTGVRCHRNACGGYRDYKIENGQIIRL